MEVLASTNRPLCLYWSEIEKWTTTTCPLRFGILPEGWHLLPVSSFATQIVRKEKVEPNRKYKMVGVRSNGGGVFHRETVLGKEQSATYLYPLEPGAVIYNRLFAWKGSFAVVGDDFSGHYVSSEFPQFEIDRTIATPEYICLVLTTNKVLDAVKAASIRSAAVSRNRFIESELLAFRIPILPLPIQQRIVAHWEAAQASVTAAKVRVAEIEKEIQARFLAELGLSKPKRSTPPKCFAATWENFERWSVSYIQAAMSMIDLTRGRYPVVELDSILKMVQYGTSEKANTKGKGAPVLRINNIKDGRIDVSELKHIPLSKKTVEGLRLVDGDILIIRTSGSRDLVGTCAVFHEEGEFVFASYLIRLRPAPEMALSDYVAWYINSPVGRQQVNTLSRQIMQNNINSQELRCLRLPLPPLDVQKEIMAHIEAGRDEIVQQTETVNQLHGQTQIEIEKMILGTRPVEMH